MAAEPINEPDTGNICFYTDRRSHMKFNAYKASALLAMSLAIFSGAAPAQNCSVDITSDDAMKYDKSVIVADGSCKEFTVNLTHSGKLARDAMGHNWVLSKAEDVQGAAMDGMQAGLANNYLKPGDRRVVAATAIIGGGEKPPLRSRSASWILKPSIRSSALSRGTGVSCGARFP
jgi:azurin